MNAPSNNSDAPDAPTPRLPDAAFTPELFRAWRSPRFGSTNPERMNNPLWEWLVRSGTSAYQANEMLNGPSAVEAGPCWCFHRFGQSATPLPDGRVVRVAGEHEDFYDPDFCIYNDVVVHHPDGRLDLFGYPRSVFPPTDFHTGTHVGRHIVLVGCLGYPEDRRPGTTPVFLLETETWSITRMETSGPSPGWLYEHTAELAEDGASLLIRQGRLDTGGEHRSLVENIEDWRLHLADGRWERLTARNWARWEFRRADRRPNGLYEFEQAEFYRKAGWRKKLEQQRQAIQQQIGAPPDLERFGQLYRPAVTHEELPKGEDDWQVFRVRIQGVVVRYVQSHYSIQMTVEGSLPDSCTAGLVSELLEKLGALEHTRYVVHPL